MTLLGFILFLIIAAACAWIADYMVPGTLPGGFFSASVCGIIGAWVGSSLIGPIGPAVEGVPLIPAIFGSAIVIVLLTLAGRGLRGAHG